jgi:NADH-quinone oxidoreductase subunit M
VALLFLLATCVHHRTQTFAMDDMGGLARKAPVLAAFFTAATFAGIGLPGFANFWGELTIFVALWRYSPMFTAAAVAGVIISAIYGLRSAARVFFGEPSQTFEEVAAKHPVSDIGWGERIPALILLATLLFIGFWPRSIARSIEAGVSAPPTVVAFASP